MILIGIFTFFILTVVHIFAQQDQNCPLDQELCMHMMMNTEAGLKMLRDLIYHSIYYVNETYKPEDHLVDFHKTYAKDEWQETISDLIMSTIGNATIDEGVSIFQEAKDDSILKEIVQKMYQKNDSSELLEFLEKIEKPNGYLYLFNDIIKNNDLHNPILLQLGDAVKTQLDVCNTTKCSEIFQDIKNQLPDVAQNIIFSKMVCIQSASHDDYYLYIGDQSDQNPLDRRVFFQQSSTTHADDLNRKWIFEPIEDGTFYQIKSANYEQYLYADSDSKLINSKYRKLSTTQFSDNNCNTVFAINVTGKNTINLINPNNNYEQIYVSAVTTNNAERQTYTTDSSNCNFQCVLNIVEC